MNLHSLRQKLFQYRGYTPIPFLIAMVAFARPLAWTMLVGGCLAVAGELLRYWGVAYAGSLTRVTGSVGAPEVITAGPYAHVRNPLYVGNIFMYTGIGIMANALSPWLVVGAFLYFTFQYVEIVTLEEEFLAQKFGEQYNEFRRNVPAFLPRWIPYRTEAQSHQQPDWWAGLRSERRTLQAFCLVVALLMLFWLLR
ncbi:MAG TPA: isoprenylcysteine carboxylmethyltransferase family protein [Bacteroidota bacterium]|nr:isoprenylcysteine carboxylmethyltransferase family protein [Bacteroidota bacterium]